MIQTLWFLVKVIVVAGLLITVASLSGEMTIELLDYQITLSTGVFLLLLGLFGLVVFFLLKMVHGIFSIPKKIVFGHEQSRHQKGFSALTRGLAAVAAGDSKQASMYARRAQSMLPNNQMGLQLLLEAQAARMRGEDGLAQNRFEALMQDKDASFLGIRGLLRASVGQGNYLLALDYAEQAMKLHPKQPEIVRTLYHLQIQNKLWSDVLKTSKKALKVNALEKEKLQSDQIAIHLMRYDYENQKGDKSKALYDLKQAYKIDPLFAPTVARYATYCLSIKKKRQATSLVKKTWKDSPHADLALIWESMAPKSNQSKILSWYQQLVDTNPENAESHIAYARAAIDLELWGAAKSSLASAEKLQPSARIYRLQAIVEQNSTQNENTIHQLMEQASEAPPDKVWICSQSGIIYEEWTPIAAPHNSFNTVTWQYPSTVSVQQSQLIPSNDGALLIDPAA